MKAANLAKYLQGQGFEVSNVSEPDHEADGEIDLHPHVSVQVGFRGMGVTVTEGEGQKTVFWFWPAVTNRADLVRDIRKALAEVAARVDASPVVAAPAEVKVTIDCETCGGEGGIWEGGTIPVACPAECDNGQVALEGDDATDELERRAFAAQKAAERRAEVAQLAAEGRSGSLDRPAPIVQRDVAGKPGGTPWPFDVALEASRDKRARRTNAHPATVAAFERLAANPERARQTSVGGFDRVAR